MNELILKLQKQAEALRARMSAALTAAEADGVSDDDKKKHLAEFDAAEADLTAVNAKLERATRLRDAEDAAQQHAASERQPAAGTPNLTLRRPDVTGERGAAVDDLTGLRKRTGGRYSCRAVGIPTDDPQPAEEVGRLIEADRALLSQLEPTMGIRPGVIFSNEAFDPKPPCDERGEVIE
jgi:hypothetical protein